MMKIKQIGLAATAFTLATNSFAVLNGPYFGLQIGQSKASNQSEVVQTSPTTTSIISPKNSGMAGRLFFGYNFNPYAAWEFGWSYYAASKYSVPGGVGTDPATRQSGFDLIGKGIYPFGTTGFGVFIQGGLAIVRVSTSATVFTSANTKGHGATTTSVRPTAGFGFSYDISQSWVADLTYSQVFGGGNVKNINFIGLGISWHWVDKYCGQFLC